MQQYRSLDEFHSAMEPFSTTSTFRVDDMLFPTSNMVSSVDLSPVLQTPSQSRQGSPDMSDDPFALFINDTPQSSHPDSAASMVLSTPPPTLPIPLSVATLIVTDCSSNNTLRQSSSSEMPLSSTSPTSTERNLLKSLRAKTNPPNPLKLKPALPMGDGNQLDRKPQSSIRGEVTNTAAEQTHLSPAVPLPLPSLESDSASVAQITAAMVVSSTHTEHGVARELDDKMPDDAQSSSTEEAVVVDRLTKHGKHMNGPCPMELDAVHCHADSLLEGAGSTVELVAVAASCAHLATKVDPELHASASEPQLAFLPRAEGTSSPVSS